MSRATVEGRERRYVEAARRHVVLADVALAVQEGARAQHDAAAFDVLPASGDHALDGLVALAHFKLLGVRHAQRGHVSAILDDREVGVVGHFRLHELLVQVSVHLGARSMHLQLRVPHHTYRRSSGGVEHAELNSAQIRHPADQAVESVDFANQVSLSDTSHRRLQDNDNSFAKSTLHDISPMVRKLVVRSAVFTPALAATDAASSPA